MTRALYAARVEKKLSRLDGVTATVNFATEKARTAFPETLNPADLIAQVEKTGYTATLLERPAPAEGDGPGPAEGRTRPQACASGCWSASGCRPVVILAMVPAAQFRDWQ